MARRGLTQDKVIDAAIEMIEARGYRNFKLHELADMLQIKTASLYNHVENIEELYSIIAIRAINLMKESLKESIADKHREEALQLMAQAYRSFILNHPELYAIIMDLYSMPDADIKLGVFLLLDPVFNVLDDYALTEEQKLHWQRILRSTIHGFTSFENKGFFKVLPVSLNETYRLAIQNIVAALESMERMNKLTGVTEA